MGSRGRKSAEELSIRVDGKPERLQPPDYMSAAERQHFKELVACCSPDHFRQSDMPLLARYVEADILAQQAADRLRTEGAVLDGRPNAWITVQEKTCRALVALSGRLRLCPQSRLDPKTVGRERKDVGPRPWERKQLWER